MDPLTGKEFGPYTIRERIGEGGMAVVYKGFQESLNRYVAIKVLRGELARDQQFIVRFRREALATAKLNHPNILHVYDAGFAHGVYYIVMDYAQGGTLKDLMARGPMDVERAVSIVAQVAEALDYAHQQGLIHRDVKPSNILITRDGRPQLTDFGIAKALYETHQLTRTGTSIGTPEYMAPEQIEGQSVDGRTDIYALGVVLYEMLSGRVPFRASTPMALIYKHVNEPPPPIRSLKADIPAWLEAVLDKALAKQMGDRYRRANEFAQALRERRAPSVDATQLSPRARPRKTPPPRERRARPPAPRRASPTATRQNATQPRRQGLIRILLGAIVGLVVIVIAVSAFLLAGDLGQNQASDGTSSVVTMVVTSEVVTRVVTAAPSEIDVLPAPTQTPVPLSVADASWYIPSLQADVTSLQFFESGTEQPARDERLYDYNFFSFDTRYINYELNLEFPSPSSRLNFDVQAIYYKPDGSVLADFSASYYLEPGWTTSWHSLGWGEDEPGTWEVGTHRVELYVDGLLVAIDEFSIY